MINYPRHEIIELSVVEFATSLAVLSHLNQHWYDLLPDDLWAGGVPVRKVPGCHQGKVPHVGAAVCQEGRNVAIVTCPAILPFAVLAPDSSAAPAAASLVPLLSPGEPSAPLLPAPPSVGLHLGLAPVKVILLLDGSPELVRVLLLVDAPPHLGARCVPTVGSDVSPSRETISKQGQQELLLTR